jgi:hypothetical protein
VIRLRPNRKHVAPRIAALMLCYLLATQAFVATLAATLAVSGMGAPGRVAFALICHGADAAAGATSGQTGDTDAFACAHCAILAGSVALPCGPVANVAAAPAIAVIAVRFAAAQPYCMPPARAGLSRAPPIAG